MSNSVTDVSAPQRYILCEVQPVTPEVNRAFGTVTRACGVILEWGGPYLVTSVLGRGRNGQNEGKGAGEEKELLKAEGGRNQIALETTEGAQLSQPWLPTSGALHSDKHRSAALRYWIYSGFGWGGGIYLCNSGHCVKPLYVHTFHVQGCVQRGFCLDSGLRGRTPTCSMKSMHQTQQRLVMEFFFSFTSCICCLLLLCPKYISSQRKWSWSGRL